MSSDKNLTFEIPHFYVDQLMHLLTSDEVKVFLYALRHLDGGKKKTDQIAHSQFVSGIIIKKPGSRQGSRHDYGTGLSKTKVTAALKELERFGILNVESKSEYKPPAVLRATEYSVQLDLGEIKLEAMQERADEKKKRGRERIATAEAIRLYNAQEKRRKIESKRPHVRLVGRDASKASVPSIGSTCT